MSEKNSFVFYLDYNTYFDMLNDEETGQILKAVFLYQENGFITEFKKGTQKMLFAMIKTTLDRDNLKWQETKQKRAVAGSKGGKAKQDKANQANATFANQNKQDKANQAVTVTDSVIDSVTVTVTDTDSVTVIKQLFFDLFINVFNEKPMLDYEKEIPHIKRKLQTFSDKDLEYVIIESFNNPFYHSLDTCTPSKMLSKKNIESCLSRKQQDEEIKALYPPEQIICQECGGKVGEDKVCYSCKIRVSDYGDFVGYYEQ